MTSTGDSVRFLMSWARPTADLEVISSMTIASSQQSQIFTTKRPPTSHLQTRATRDFFVVGFCETSQYNFLALYNHNNNLPARGPVASAQRLDGRGVCSWRFI